MKHYVRFGYHKCLTVFFKNIFIGGFSFGSSPEKFLAHLNNQNRSTFAALNNRVLDTKIPPLQDSKIFHVIRHPKDIIVSGYFYHKKGAGKMD